MKNAGNHIGFLLAVFFIAVKSFAQLSPGELSDVHAHLEGITNCTKCHVLGEKETSAKCLACHTEIKKLVDQKKGYHASAEVTGQRCAACHGEHYGRDFEVVRMNQDNFNHNLTGFKLEAKHAEITCIDCHKAALIKNKISQKKSAGTFLGMGTECIDCHTDVHQNTLSQNCTACHNQEAFVPATGFDHAATKFPLVGKHKEVDCSKCHEKTTLNGNPFQQFADVQFASCTSCHEDVHNNKFGNDCRKCHDEFSFTQVKNIGAFNHNNTDYPLRGKHVSVDCKECHTSGNHTKAVPHTNCTDCHSDFHKGQLAKNGVSPDCNSCHSVDGFSPSSFGLERHNNTEFALNGAHMATPCFECHKKGEEWNFKFEEINCTACHKNIHEDKISSKFMPDSDCRACHNETIWSQINFDHNKTNFKLEGKHTTASCRDCHFNETAEVSRQKFAGLAADCANCHDDIHFGQFEESGKNDCERCHTFKNWLPEKFNHENSRFKIDGKHEGLECIACHKPTDNLIRNYIVYKFEDITCASCH